MSGPFDWDDTVLAACQDSFGEPVRWKSADGLFDDEISGIFDDAYKSYEMMNEDGMSPTHVTASLPILGCRSSSFPAGYPHKYPAQGDKFIIRKKEYVCQEVRPDSHGALHLVLNAGDAPLEMPRQTTSPKIRPWEM